MAQLDFQEIARLINHSRTSEIDLTPKVKERSWSLYDGHHKVHTATFPFSVLYLQSSVTQQDLLASAKYVGEDHSTHVVFPASVRTKHSAFINSRRLFKNADGVWTIKEYLVSFIDDEVQKYLEKLRAQEPK